MSSGDAQDPYLNKKRNYHFEDGEVGDHIKFLINKLVALRDQTSPERGEATAVGKDEAAFDALNEIGGLIHGLASWAIDHQLGLAIHNRQFLPRGNPATRALPIYKDAKLEVDDHKHEIAAVEYHRNERTLNVEEKRRFMSNVLSLMNNSFPGDIAEELAEALRALEYGEVMPILQPKRTGRKVNFTEQREQLRAITFAKFRHASGLMSAGDAQGEVARSFGVSTETLRTWEKRLRDVGDRLDVSRHLAFAASAASYIEEQKRKNRSLAQSMLEDHPRYGKKEMLASAERYQASRKVEEAPGNETTSAHKWSRGDGL